MQYIALLSGLFLDSKKDIHLFLTNPRWHVGLFIMAAAMSTACHTSANDRNKDHNSVTIGALTISSAYLVAPVGDAPAAMYFTVQNSGATGDTMTGIQVAGVEHSELHMEVMSKMAHTEPHSMSHNMPQVTMTTMLPTPAVAVPANTVLRLLPGGRHVMLIGMQRSFKSGDSTYAKISFRHAGIIHVPVRVIDYTQTDTLLRGAAQ